MQKGRRKFPHKTCVGIRGFVTEVYHFGIDARIVLEQNKFSKKKLLLLTGLETLTLGLSTVLAFCHHALPLC